MELIIILHYMNWSTYYDGAMMKGRKKHSTIFDLKEEEEEEAEDIQ